MITGRTPQNEGHTCKHSIVRRFGGKPILFDSEARDSMTCLLERGREGGGRF